MPLESLLPLFVYFVTGVILPKAGVLKSEHADVLFRVVFNVTLPALAFLSVANAPLSRDSALLPVTALLVNLSCLGAAYLCSRIAGDENRAAGTLRLGTGIINMVFIFPFILGSLGQPALADAVLFDLGNAIFVATVATSIAIRYGHVSSLRFRDAALRLLGTPLFLALALAIIFNLGDLRVPVPVTNTLSPLGATTIPLTIVALGLSFNLSGLRGRMPFVAILLRMPFGLLVGAATVWLFGIEGTTAIVVLVSAAAPIGFSAVTLASVAKLNVEQAAAAVSLSVLLGLFTTTALLWFGSARF